MWVSEEKVNQIGRHEQLCWTCQNADTNGCSWSRSLKPIKGWDADVDTIIKGGTVDKSYRIYGCPEYIADKEVAKVSHKYTDHDRDQLEIKLRNKKRKELSEHESKSKTHFPPLNEDQRKRLVNVFKDYLDDENIRYWKVSIELGVRRRTLSQWFTGFTLPSRRSSYRIGKYMGYLNEFGEPIKKEEWQRDILQG